MAKTVKKQHPGRIAPILTALLLISGAVSLVTAQAPVPAIGAGSTFTNAMPAIPNYRLGPDDEVYIVATYADETTGRAYRLSVNGDLNLPDKIGIIHASGMTVEEL